MKLLLNVGIILIVFHSSMSCEKTALAEQDRLFSKSKMIKLLNQYRQSGTLCGETYFPPVGKLKWNEKLEQVAIMHSDDMQKRKYFDHSSPEGQRVEDRMNVTDYEWSYLGENLAYGTLKETSVVKEWMSSPGHCRNIMNANYTEMGISLKGLYWTQVLAKPKLIP